MKRFLAMLAVFVMAVGMAGSAFGEERIDISKAAYDESLKILKELCEEYDRNGRLDEEQFYAAGLYFELYVKVQILYYIEVLMKIDEDMVTADGLIKSGAEFSDTFHEMFADWIETKDNLSASVMMAAIKWYINK